MLCVTPKRLHFLSRHTFSVFKDTFNAVEHVLNKLVHVITYIKTPIINTCSRTKISFPSPLRVNKTKNASEKHHCPGEYPMTRSRRRIHRTRP